MNGLRVWAFFAIVCASVIAQADQLPAETTESIFLVDGLMVGEKLTPPPEVQVFTGELKKYPLVDVKPAFRFTAPYMTDNNRPVSFRRLEVFERQRSAEAYMDEKDWDQALAEIQRALVVDPDDLTLVQRAAALAALARKFGLAEVYFRRYVSMNPNSIQYLVGWAGVLIRLYRFDEADSVLKRALQLRPDDLGARFNSACIVVLKDRTELIRQDWLVSTTSELEMMANWLDADRSDLLSVMGEDKFKTFCGIILGKGTDERLREIVGLLREFRNANQMRNWALIEQLVERGRVLGLHEAGLSLDLGHAVYEMGEHETAKNLMRDLADQYPKSVSMLYNYGFVLIMEKDYPRASMTLEKAVRLSPQDGQLAFALVCAYAGQGAMDRAWPILEELARKYPQNMEGWMEGNQPYLLAIRNDPRYDKLMAAHGESPEPASP